MKIYMVPIKINFKKITFKKVSGTIQIDLIIIMSKYTTEVACLMS